VRNEQSETLRLHIEPSVPRSQIKREWDAVPVGADTNSSLPAFSEVTKDIIIIMLMLMKKAGASAQKKESEISTNELRLKFDRVLKAVRQGRSLTLTYRNKPLARIVPLKEENLLQEDDPIYRMYEHAEPIGAPLTNEEMDQLIYGS
jgi:prevent-host-death family protein